MVALRIYRFALFGAAGGLVASFLHQGLLLDTLASPLSAQDRFRYLALLGALVGAAIGFFPRFADGLSRYSTWRAARLGLLGAALGGLGGFCTLPLAEWLHARMRGGLEGRAFAWAALGLTIGFAEGIGGEARKGRGLLGGLLGGVLAGSLVEVLLARQDTSADSGIAALIVVGLAISLGVALFVNVLSEAWLEGLPGSKVDGQIYHLSKFRGGRDAVLGSDKKSTVLVWVPDAEPQHAALSVVGGVYVLRNLATGAATRVDGVPVSEHRLRDKQVIQVASARLRYRERRDPRRWRAPARAASL
jgi:hypothetical protein